MGAPGTNRSTVTVDGSPRRSRDCSVAAARFAAFVNLTPLGTRIVSRVSRHPEPPVCLKSFSIASKFTPLRSEGLKSSRTMTSRKALRSLRDFDPLEVQNWWSKRNELRLGYGLRISLSFRRLGGGGGGGGGGADVNPSSNVTRAGSGMLEGLAGYSLDRPNLSKADRSGWWGGDWGEGGLGGGGVVLLVMEGSSWPGVSAS